MVDVVIRRWKFTIAALVIGLVGTFVYQWYNRVPEECVPVNELLDFYNEKWSAINAKSEGEDALSPVAEDAAYGALADGVAQRAGKVTDPALAAHAVQLSTLVNQFANKVPQVRAESDAHVQGAPTPPVVYEMNVLSTRILAEESALRKACKR